MGGFTRPATAALYKNLPAESSQYSTRRPTKLDKIKNFHLKVQVGAIAKHSQGTKMATTLQKAR